MSGAVLTHADPSGRLDLRLQASAAGLDGALNVCDDFMRQHAVEARTRERVRLLLEEAVMNVAMHGGPAPVGALQIDLALCIRPGAIELQIDDDGRPFDASTAAAPARPTSLAEAVPGGMGLHLMRRFARAMHYARRDSRNCLTLTLDRA